MSSVYPLWVKLDPTLGTVGLRHLDRPLGLGDALAGLITTLIVACALTAYYATLTNREWLRANRLFSVASALSSLLTLSGLFLLYLGCVASAASEGAHGVALPWLAGQTTERNWMSIGLVLVATGLLPSLVYVGMSRTRRRVFRRYWFGVPSTSGTPSQTQDQSQVLDGEEHDKATGSVGATSQSHASMVLMLLLSFVFVFSLSAVAYEAGGIPACAAVSILLFGALFLVPFPALAWYMEGIPARS